MKILIIEDEPSLNKEMVNYLESQQYLCESVTTYTEALAKIEYFPYDCIVLDIMLPGGSGLQLLKHLKADRKTDGVIIISARGELDDKILGLRLGADDYLTKPFYLPELSMRIEAIIRRKNFQGNTSMNFEEIHIDIEAKAVTVNGKQIILTRKEYELLLYFIINKNRVLSKNAITSHLWGDYTDSSGNYEFIYTHVKNLRKKLLAAGSADYIQSIYGIGYKLSQK